MSKPVSGRDKSFTNLKNKGLSDSIRDRKIMLTDLCPEEKAKVGYLMMKMEKDRERCEQLTEYLNYEKQKRQRLEQTLQQQTKYLTLLRLLNEESKKYIEILNNEAKKERRKQQEDKYDCTVEKTTVYCQTVRTDKLNKYTQCGYESKANKSIQTEEYQFELKKSSTTGMKSSHSMTPMATFPYDRTQEDEQVKSRAIPPLPKPKVEGLTYEYLSSYRAEASELAKAWLEMKKYTLYKMKKDVKKCQKKFGHSITDETNSDEDVNSSSLSRSNYKRLLMAINRLNRESTSKATLPYYCDEVQKQYDKGSAHDTLSGKYDTYIDEYALNKLLKSNDFKASRFVKSTGKNSAHESSRKNYKANFYDSDLLDLINDLS